MKKQSKEMTDLKCLINDSLTHFHFSVKDKMELMETLKKIDNGEQLDEIEVKKRLEFILFNISF